jgi:outer membrane protein assembly factor BamB
MECLRIKKDGDGYIAKVGLDGKNHHPKMGYWFKWTQRHGYGGEYALCHRYDRLVAIDIATGKISKTWNVKGAGFLNDITTAEDGTVYFTDTNTNSVHQLSNGNVTTLVAQDAMLGGPNGIFWMVQA